MARNYLTRSYRYYREHGYWASVRLLARRSRKKLIRSRDPAPLEIARYLAALDDPELSSPPAPARSLFRTGFVAVIGELGLQQCKKYRILQKLECLEIIGSACSYSHWADLPRCFDMIQIASTVIFYRVQDNIKFQAYVREARRLGVTILYDIDDPIFDRDIYAQNPNLEFLAGKEMRELLSSSPRYVKAINQCDGAIVSTPGMRDVLSRHFTGDIYLWRNAIDKASSHAAAMALKDLPASPTGRVTIGYASGSRAHEADFREAAGALTCMMKKFPQTDLKILGHLELTDELKAFGARISETPFSGYDAYFRALGTFDISIVPLVRDEFNGCKSAIRYLEASLVNVPSIISSIGDFTNVIISEETGRLAKDTAQWMSHLEDLITSPETRRTMAERARVHVLETQTTHAVMQSMDSGLAALLGKTSHDR